MQGVVERKNTIPILSNILLKAADGHLIFTSTDLDLTLLSQAEAKVSRPGSVTVPARKLFDLIRNLPEADVAPEADGEPLPGRHLRAVELPARGAAGRGLSDGPQGGGEGGLTFPLDLWKRLTRKVLYAVSAEETRFQLMGALLKDKGKEFELVATDGHRLALIDFPEGKREGNAFRTSSSRRKRSPKFSRWTGRAEAQLEIQHSENHLLFRVGSRQLIARLLDVNFPDYEKILGKGNDKVAHRSARRPASPRSAASRSSRRSGRAACSSPSRRTS